MSKEAMKLALEALEGLWKDGFEGYPAVLHEQAITALREALAEQPAQQEAKIVRWNCPCGNKYTFHGFTKAPPQRTWVGLTDAEVMQTMSGDWTSQFYFARAIEAKLKEKNI